MTTTAVTTGSGGGKNKDNRRNRIMKVYQAINKIQEALAKDGISKGRTNTFDNYKFRGIDDVYNALSPLLAKHGLCILPRVLSRICDERVSRKGDPMFYVTVEAEFDFVCAEDGSKHTVKTYGEAMDRSDKATNKAMSAAYKYAAFQAFAIPTEGDHDADAETPEVAPRQQTHQPFDIAKAIEAIRTAPAEKLAVRYRDVALERCENDEQRQMVQAAFQAYAEAAMASA